jgi:menaquinol-cytochrome c reductase iron-sulfur subunit
MSDDDPDDLTIPPGDPGRRRFLKVATCAIGGGLGAVIVVPAIRYLVDPVGRRVVVAADEPIDVGAIDDLDLDGAPVARRLIARSVRDAWSTSQDVPLGTVWLVRTGADDVRALSAICPHLGCAVAFHARAGEFQCPCHDSAFAVDGRRKGGPAERDLDPLPVEPITQIQRRILVTWIRYRPGGSTAVPS